MSRPPLRWKPPEEVRFGKNAKWIQYGQDMQFKRGDLPGDVWFRAEKVMDNGQVRLTAYGFGLHDKKLGPKPYGNGAIYVNWMDVAIWGRKRHDDAA